METIQTSLVTQLNAVKSLLRYLYKNPVAHLPDAKEVLSIIEKLETSLITSEGNFRPEKIQDMVEELCIQLTKISVAIFDPNFPEMVEIAIILCNFVLENDPTHWSFDSLIQMLHNVVDKRV